MKINSTSKVAAMVAGLAIATSMLTLAPMASAASLTSAQVSSILTMISAFGADSATIANVNAALTGSSSTSGSTVTTTGGTSACTFSRSLTIGATGTDVTCLQQALITGGFSIPAGATGYFGTQTRTAVASWQSSKNIAPAVGYFGPISRAAFDLGGSTTSTTNTTTTTTTTTSTTAGCAAGAAFSSTTGAACASTTTTTATPGAEGSFTLSQAVAPADNTNVTTNTDTTVYGMKVKATGSNMNIDRVDLEFAVTVNSSTINPSGFITSISAYDGSTLLKTMPLSSSDFTKGSTNLYSVRMTSIGFSVPKDTEKTLTFKINTNAVSASDYTRTMTVRGENVGSNDVRGTDGAGLSTYANLSWTSSFTFQASNSAVLTGTLNSASPKAQTIATTTDGISGVVMQKFDIKSTSGISTLTDLLVTVGTSVATAKPTAVYIYDGTPSTSSLLGSVAPATVTAGSTYTATFTNLELAIAKDATKTITVTADFPATAVGIASTSIATTAATTAYETADGTTKNVTISSAMIGNDVHIYGGSAPMWTLVSATMTPAAGVVSSASSSLTGVIVLKAKAMGGTMTKPVATDFDVFFASSTQRTTNGGTGYDAATGLTGTHSVTVTPTDATIGDGSEYTVTLTGVLYSNDSEFGSSQALFMAIDDIDSVVGGTTIANQSWGIDTFITPTAQLTKGTL